VGTLSRFYHWWTCNVRPRLSRKNSKLHESDLNIELAIRAGVVDRAKVETYSVLSTQINVTPSTIVNTGPNFLKNTTELFELSDSLDYGFKIQPFLPKDLQFLDQDRRVKIILHPGSRNSARNWPVTHFSGLHSLLNDDRFLVFITGTEEEGINIRSNFDFSRKNIFDLTGKLSLAELMGFILKCDVLVANSTGPLQIAAALGIHAVGIYPPVRPMHPGRWAPRGKKVTVLSKMGLSNCKLCQNISNCQCMSAVNPHEVFKAINKNIKT
ncbi:MAG: glycosyltransferase family 9 protein, partial [Bdellovibrionales bacterium]